MRKAKVGAYDVYGATMATLSSQGALLIAGSEPVNPMTGEPEDTDVGFPGPEHHVAEQSAPMRAAMAPLALLAVIGGVVGIPGLTDTLEHFLEPTFEGSELAHEHPSEGAEWIGLAVGGIVAAAGILGAYLFYVTRPELRLNVRRRFAAANQFLVNKWYFDELFDLAIVRPAGRAGQFGRTVVESRFVQGVLVGGTVGIVRAGTAFARSIQTGELRGYALLLLMGMSGLVLYFLVVSS